MRYNIFHKNETLIPFCTAVSVELSDKWMEGRSVSAEIQSPTPLEFEMGDYIEYLGQKYVINYNTNVLKQSSAGSTCSAFKYSGVKFYDENIVALKNCRMTDAVDNGSFGYFANPKFNLHCDTVEDFIRKCIDNLDRLYGKEKWAYEILPDTESAQNVDIEINNQSVWEALSLVASKFFTGVIIEVKNGKPTIVVGSYVSTADTTFRYGKGKGLVTIERTYQNEEEIITRLYAYGSTKNLPSNYYSDIYDPNYRFNLSNTPNSASVAIVGKQPLEERDATTGKQLAIFLLALPVYHSPQQGEAFEFQIRNEFAVLGTYSGKWIVNPNKDPRWTYYTFTGPTDAFEVEDRYPHINILVTKGILKKYATGLKRQWESKRPIAPIGLGINNLMLPDFLSYDEELNREKTDVYVEDADAAAKYGVREGCVIFDNEDIGDIYPTIEGLRSETLALAGHEPNLPAGDNGFMDEILWATYPDDDGFISNTDTGLEAKLPDTFYVYLKDIGFDIKEHLSTSDAKLIFNSGNLAGREFNFNDGSANPWKVWLAYKNEVVGGVVVSRQFKELKDNEAVPSGYDGKCIAWKCSLHRYNDTTLDMWFPNNIEGNGIDGQLVERPRNVDDSSGVYHSDNFVLVDIEMPTILIEEAEQRLQKAAEEYIKDNLYQKCQYNVKLDKLFMQRDFDENGTESLRYNLRAGTIFKFADEDIDADDRIKDETWYIDNISIKEDGNSLPEYNVTLKQDIEMTSLQKMQRQIVVLNRRTNDITNNLGGNVQQSKIVSNIFGGSGDVSKADVTRIGDERYAQLAAENEFTGDVNTFKGITAEEVISNTVDAETLSADYLDIRRAAFFRTLTISEVEHMGGEVILSAAACRVGHVSKPIITLDDGIRYKCYFEKNANGRTSYNEWKVNDLAYCQRWTSEVGSGTTGQRTGTHFYWAKVVAVGEEGEYWTITLSFASDKCAPNSIAPQANDEIVLLGHDTSGYDEQMKAEYAPRTSAQVYSTVGTGAPSRRYYTGITTFVLPEPIETLEYDASDGYAHWRVGDNKTYIDFKDGLKIKAKEISLESVGNIGDAFNEKFEIHHGDSNAPTDRNGKILEKVRYTDIDVSESWTLEEARSHIGDYLLTQDGVSYQLEETEDGIMWVVSSDRYLLNAMNFVSGFRSSDAFAELFTEVHDAQGNVVNYASAKTTVDLDENGEVKTKFVVKGDKMEVDTDNFKLNENGLTVKGDIHANRYFESVVTYEGKTTNTNLGSDDYPMGTVIRLIPSAANDGSFVMPSAANLAGLRVRILAFPKISSLSGSISNYVVKLAVGGLDLDGTIVMSNAVVKMMSDGNNMLDPDIASGKVLGAKMELISDGMRWMLVESNHCHVVGY